MEKTQFIYLSTGELDLQNWLTKIKQEYAIDTLDLLERACVLAQQFAKDKNTFYGQPCLELGLNVVETILELNLIDQHTVAAAVIGSAIPLLPETTEQIKKELGDDIFKLILGTQQIDIIPAINQKSFRNKNQTEQIRNMLLTMATDIRVVIIKLAERLCFMRGIKNIPIEERKPYAKEILEIYAPLANRLGIGQLKWELEDYAFHYLEPMQYKTIATFLAERRTDREKRIQKIITELQTKLAHVNFKFKISGRPKHIYSIYLKTQRKNLSIKDIYDSNAVRILVPQVEDCYTALSLVHSLWQPIMKEFDDYIAHPKANGYRSIHTTLIDEDEKHFEIQIRTFAMHEEAERGIAAHWIYKEGQRDKTAKMNYLHQLLDWHQELEKSALADTASHEIYVITPMGEILNLTQGATPLDFAYHIHSELGHRCRGAKVNGQIVPLTYTLRTGDKVEILTIVQGNPSRDWLNTELGYVKTQRAKNKIMHWFKQQALQADLESGRQTLERELTKIGMSKSVSLSTLARQLEVKNEDALFVALARGHVRLSQILQIIKPTHEDELPIISSLTTHIQSRKNAGNAIVGANDLLTRLSKCCKPIPGDEIIGYITQGRGISIHKKKCRNMPAFVHQERFIVVNWNEENSEFFSTDLKITAENNKTILQDLAGLFANAKITLLNLQSSLDKNQNKIFITATIQVQNKLELQRLQERIGQLPQIIHVN